MQYTTQYRNLPVLITGGCGFIGSHLAYTLVQNGAQVTILDNLSTGSLENIASIKNNLRFIHADIRDSQACLDATRNQTTIFHLAAFISVPESHNQPYTCFDINVHGTTQLLEAARINRVERLVFSSSAAVYGQHSHAITEDDPCNPTSPYGYSKILGELLCKQYTTIYSLKTIILRYFNVWGETQNPHSPYAGVIARFLNSIRNNEPVIIYGNGKQTRDFVHVSQVVKANIYAGLWDSSLAGQVFNIGTGISYSLLEMATKLRKQFPACTSSLQFNPARTGDITHSAANCTKYRRLIENE